MTAQSHSHEADPASTCFNVTKGVVGSRGPKKCLAMVSASAASPHCPALSQLPLQGPAAPHPPWLTRDRFRTMINVLGDALAAGIMAHICRKDFAQDTGTEVRTVPPSLLGYPKAPGRWSQDGLGTKSSTHQPGSL